MYASAAKALDDIASRRKGLKSATLGDDDLPCKVRLLLAVESQCLQRSVKQ